MRAAIATALIGAVAVLVAAAAYPARQSEPVPTLACDETVIISASTNDRVVVRRVALPPASRVLHFSRYGGPPYFAKHGVAVRGSGPVTLRVPDRFRTVYGLIGAGTRSLAVAAKEVRIEPCNAAAGGGPNRWTGHPFGYLVLRPVCVPLIVEADGRRATIRLSIGRRCA